MRSVCRGSRYDESNGGPSVPARAAASSGAAAASFGLTAQPSSRSAGCCSTSFASMSGIGILTGSSSTIGSSLRTVARTRAEGRFASERR